MLSSLIGLAAPGDKVRLKVWRERATRDIEVKLPEYRTVQSLQAILYIDPEDETIHLELRDETGEWTVVPNSPDGRVELPILNVTLSRDEIFARS